MIRLTSSGVTTTSAGVDDGEHQEHGDLPAVRPGEAERSGGPCLGRCLLSTDAPVGAQCRPPRRSRIARCISTLVLPTPASARGSPIRRGQLAEPPACASRSAGAARRGPVRRAQQQRLRLAHRTRQRREQGRGTGPRPSLELRRRVRRRCARPMRQRLRRADPRGPSRRSPAPGSSRRARPAALFPPGRGPARAPAPSCRTGRRRRRPAGRRPGPAGSRRRSAWPCTAAIADERGPRSHENPCWNSAIALDALRRRLRARARAAAPRRRRSPGSSIARSSPAENDGPSPDTTTTRTSSGSAAPIVARPATSPGSARCAPPAGRA